MTNQYTTSGIHRIKRRKPRKIDSDFYAIFRPDGTIRWDTVSKKQESSKEKLGNWGLAKRLGFTISKVHVKVDSLCLKKAEDNAA